MSAQAFVHTVPNWSSPPAGVDVVREDARRQAQLGGVRTRDRVGLGVEHLEGRDRAEDFLLHDVRADVLDLRRPERLPSRGRRARSAWQRQAPPRPRRRRARRWPCRSSGPCRCPGRARRRRGHPRAPRPAGREPRRPPRAGRNRIDEGRLTRELRPVLVAVGQLGEGCSAAAGLRLPRPLLTHWWPAGSRASRP